MAAVVVPSSVNALALEPYKPESRNVFFRLVDGTVRVMEVSSVFFLGASGCTSLIFLVLSL
jgi:hypothetical protein